MAMLHLRVISPRDRTSEVLAALEGHGSVRHVVCLEAVVRDPEGDLVTALVHRDATDSLVADLERIGNWGNGMVSFTDVDLALVDPTALDPDGTEDWDEGADVVVWEAIAARARDDAQASWNYLLSMAAAGVIAAVGVMTDQPILIVGAMAVSPDLARITAVNVGVVTRDPPLGVRALRTLLLGLACAVIVSGLVAAFSSEAGLLPSSFSLAGLDQVGFVSRPDAFSVIVACAAGVAGMLAFENAKAGPAVGVAISVTTIPAAAAIGVAVVATEGHEALGPLTQLGLNVVCLVAAGSITLGAQRGLRRRPRH